LNEEPRMSERHAAIHEAAEGQLDRYRNQIDALVQHRRANLARLESVRLQAREAGLSAVEDFFLQVQQNDQRIIEQAEQLFGAVRAAGRGESPANEQVDESSAESFPASDPPTHSRFT